MNLNTSPVRDRLRQSIPAEHRPASANDIKEFCILEECVARCESFAEQISGADEHRALMDDLSECIAACQTYLASKSRESRHEARLRAYCADALGATAASCKSLHNEQSKACRKIVRAALRLIGAHGPATGLPFN